MINIGLRNQKASPDEILFYIKNKTNIPFELFKKYNNKYASIHKVEFKCELCNNNEVTSWNNLNNRIRLYDKICCKKCSYVYSTCLRENIPDEIIEYYFNKKDIPFNLYLKYKSYNANKLYIKIKCEYCANKSRVRWSKIKFRQHSSDKQICNKCIQKYTSNLEIVKKRNSDSQLIVQNRQESKEKQRIAQIRRCKENPESIRKQIIGIKKFYSTGKGIKLKEEAIKRLKNSGHLTGYYSNIKFDSSWELSLLVHYENQNIKRSNLKIPYEYNGEKKTYFPDFILNDKYLLEVKGRIHEINNIKKNATIDFLKRNNIDLKYKILYFNDLKNLNVTFFKSIESLSILNVDKLEILEYPKSWKNS